MSSSSPPAANLFQTPHRVAASSQQKAPDSNVNRRASADCKQQVLANSDRKISLEHPTRKLSRQDARAFIDVDLNAIRKHSTSGFSLPSTPEVNNNYNNSNLSSEFRFFKMPVTDTTAAIANGQKPATITKNEQSENTATNNNNNNNNELVSAAKLPETAVSEAALKKAAEAEKGAATNGNAPIPSYASIFQPPSARFQKHQQKIAAEAKLVAKAVRKSSTNNKQGANNNKLSSSTSKQTDIDSIGCLQTETDDDDDDDEDVDDDDVVHKDSVDGVVKGSKRRVLQPLAIATASNRMPGSVVYVPLVDPTSGMQIVGCVSGGPNQQFQLGAPNSAVFYPSADVSRFDKISSANNNNNNITAAAYDNNNYQPSSRHSHSHRNHNHKYNRNSQRHLSGNLNAFAASKLNNANNKHYLQNDSINDSSEDDSYHKQRFANEICMAAAQDPLFRNYSRYSRCHLMLKSIILALVLVMLLGMIVGVILLSQFAPSLIQELIGASRSFNVTIAG